MQTKQILERSAARRILPSATSTGQALLPAIGPLLSFARGEEIFGQGQPADHIYQVVHGVVRTCRFAGDGYRQIEDFHLAGEYFGLESGAEHRCSAEAVGTATVLLLRRSALKDLASRDVAVAGQLMKLAMTALERTRQHLAMLSRNSAAERVAAFLADFARRSGDPALVDLPMSRQEIADYLGLTVETVSRTFTQLAGDGIIGLPGPRRVSLLSPDRLASCCA